MKSDRFQSGKEIKKNISNWGLRKYLPPPIQLVIFDSSVKITSKYLKDNTLINLITEEEGSDNVVLKKIAENVSYVADEKQDIQQTSSCKTLSKTTISFVPKSPKILPRSSTLRKRKMNFSGRSSEEPCSSNTSGTMDYDSIEGNRSISLIKKLGPLKLLEELIPRTPSFNGIHNPFRIPSPKKVDPKIKSELIRLKFSTKIAALKRTGVIIKKRQKITAGQLKGEILIKKRKLVEKDIIVNADNKIKRKRGRKPIHETEVSVI